MRALCLLCVCGGGGGRGACEHVSATKYQILKQVADIDEIRYEYYVIGRHP